MIIAQKKKYRVNASDGVALQDYTQPKDGVTTFEASFFPQYFESDNLDEMNEWAANNSVSFVPIEI